MTIASNINLVFFVTSSITREGADTNSMLYILPQSSFTGCKIWKSTHVTDYTAADTPTGRHTIVWFNKQPHYTDYRRYFKGHQNPFMGFLNIDLVAS